MPVNENPASNIWASQKIAAGTRKKAGNKLKTSFFGDNEPKQQVSKTVTSVNKKLILIPPTSRKIFIDTKV